MIVLTLREITLSTVAVLVFGGLAGLLLGWASC